MNSMPCWLVAIFFFPSFHLTSPFVLLLQVLSTGLGRIVPNLISRKHTNSAATGMVRLNFTLLLSLDFQFQKLYSLYA
jgi:hypothetical protein